MKINKIPVQQHILAEDIRVGNSGYKFYFNKPMLCPHCSFGTDAPCVSYQTYQEIYLVVAYKCTSCGKIYLVTYEVSISQKKAKFVDLYPSIQLSFYDPLIADCSPRFIDMYNQALASESAGNIDLAAIGYRSALEILVKDYAIKELQAEEENTKSMSLFKAIKTYLNDDAAWVSANVVRIKGNDYTHYEEKYSDVDFNTLKEYMNIFISLVKTQLMIKHPPVGSPERPKD